MPLQADADFQVLLLRFFGGGKKAAHARSISCDGFFRENVFVLAHRLFELHWPESWRRGENDDVSKLNRFFVGIESDELPVRRHIDAVFVFGREIAQAAFQMVFENISHGDEFDWPLSAQSLVGR